MKKNYGKIVAVLFALTAMSLSIVSGTLAKYTTKISGTANAKAKSFVFDVKSGETAFSEAALLPADILPGDTGSIEINLSNSSEIAVDIDFDATTTASFPIKYYVSAAPVQEGTSPTCNIEGTGLATALDALVTDGMAAKTGENPTTKTVYVYWKWIENNATDINFQGQTYTLSLDVTATQG